MRAAQLICSHVGFQIECLSNFGCSVRPCNSNRDKLVVALAAVCGHSLAAGWCDSIAWQTALAGTFLRGRFEHLACPSGDRRLEKQDEIKNRDLTFGVVFPMFF